MPSARAVPPEEAVEPPVEHRYVASLQLGFAFPFADAEKDLPLRDLTQGAIPFVVDAGYRFSSRVTASVYGSFGPAVGECPNAAGCGGWGLKVGVRGELSLAPVAFTEPWVGLGVGYEILEQTRDFSGGGSTTTNYNGVELLRAQIGVRFPVGDHFELGPVIDGSLGQYLSASTDGVGGSLDRSAVHGWFFFGVRGELRI